MNCPHHIQIFAAQPRSYRDLPVRLAEFGTVYRYEQSGELSGLTRVRGFTQDDAHLFCTHDQVRGEFKRDDGTDPVLPRIASASPTTSLRLSKQRPGRPQVRRRPRGRSGPAPKEDIRSVLDEMGLPYEEAAGEAAFYGPKADFIVQATASAASGSSAPSSSTTSCPSVSAWNTPVPTTSRTGR